MPTLAASTAAVQRAAVSPSPLASTTLLAQLGGWGGDVALLAPGTRPFLVGTGSFGLGHVAYLVGFWRRRSATPFVGSRAVRAVAVSWLLTAPAVAVMAARRERALGMPVLGYSTLLAAMVAAGSHLDPALPLGARRLTAAGAWLFLVSDTTLAVRAFVLEEPPAGMERVVMATYTLAQLLLAEGAVRS